MRVPVSWLRDYVAFDKPLPELAELMSMTGTKVEALHRRGVPDGLDLYRVGRVLTREQHPNADRLSLCTVDIGQSEPQTIVCGADNYQAGATVAVALPGAVLPDGTELRVAKLRGDRVARDDALRARARPRPGARRDHAPAGRLAGRRRADRPPGNRRRRARVRDHVEPARLPERVRHRARGLGRARHRPRAMAGDRARGRGFRHRRRLRLGAGRRARPLPALGRPRLHRRQGGPVAAVAQGSHRGCGHAPDLERRRHHQLRDAGDRRAHPRVRPRQGRRPRDHRPPGTRRRACDDARRPGTHARPRRPRDRGRRAAVGDRRPDGRGVERGDRRDDDRPHRVRELRRPVHAALVDPARPPHGRLEQVGEGPRSAPAAEGARARVAADGRAHRRQARTGHDRRARRAARAAGGGAAQGAARGADGRRVHRPGGRAVAHAAGIRAGRRQVDRPHLARRRHHPRGRSDRGGHADRRDRARARRDARRPSRRRPARR